MRPISLANASDPPRADRIGAVDWLRGLALLGMAAFHCVWDLRYFGLTTIDPVTSLPWRLFGQAIAAAFLALSGVSLVLARPTAMRPAATLRRLGIVAGAAGVVSLATWIVIPAQTIEFGILHCIVATNLVALAILRWPLSALAVLSVASLVAPLALRGLVPDGPAWWWIGLANGEPQTVDFRPVLPWLAPVLLGVIFARAGGIDVLARLPSASSTLRALAVAGRHSLALYLIHQPVLFAILFGVSRVLSSTQDAPVFNPAQATDFLRECRAACVKSSDSETCGATCHCVVTAILKNKVNAPSASPGLSAITARCVAASGD